MADTFDQGAAALSATPLTQAVVAAATYGGETTATAIGPRFDEPTKRALIDALASLEARVIALGG